MRVKLYTFWEHISTSFWFIPALMVALACALALGTLVADQSITPADWESVSWIYVGGPDGARSILSTIAGSMISVTGVTFSITIVALSLASSQFGPRLLDNFMRDRGNQIVLGTFVSVFIYSLLILRAIRSSDALIFVPHLSVTVAMLQAFASVGVLIYFFHHVSINIQAQNVIASIGRELENSLERLVSAGNGQQSYEYELRDEADIPDDFDEQAHYIKASGNGYLQAIDYALLQEIAEEKDLLVKVLYRPGDFVARGSETIKVYSSQSVADELQAEVMNAFTFGAKRLRIQDVEFAIDQLVEIAVRALSPGINDPFTAIACLDQLGTTLSGLAGSNIPSGFYYDDAGNLRVISDSLTFQGMINGAFDQIRQHGRSDVAVMIRFLEVIAIIMTRASAQARKEALLRQAEMVKRASDETIFEENDRQDIQSRYDLIVRIFNNEQDIATDEQESERPQS